MAAHEQVWIKVNAPVDAGVAEIVSLLNSVGGLETLQSCEGDVGGRNGYVYFTCGGWREICQLVFQKVGPVLKSRLEEDVTLNVEATSADAPMAKLSFKAEATGMVVSALNEVLC
ncbi:MAG: hypothetical protein LAN70_03790 [Acidobacteriia bacterium]|nr:hypothetical protein [Terriglobia bacterium]